MALTVTSLENAYAGNKRVNRGRLSLDASYPAGGYPITPNQVGLLVIEFLEIFSQQGFGLYYDPVRVTVRVYALSMALVASQPIGTPIQVDALGNIGKTTAGPLTTFGTPADVPTGTNLAAVTNVPFKAEGV